MGAAWRVRTADGRRAARWSRACWPRSDRATRCCSCPTTKARSRSVARPISGRAAAARRGAGARVRGAHHRPPCGRSRSRRVRCAESHALNRELFWISDFQAAGFVAGEGQARPRPSRRAVVRQARTYLVPLRRSAPRQRGAHRRRPGAGRERRGARGARGLRSAPPRGTSRSRWRRSEPSGALGRGFVAMPEHGEADALLPLARLPGAGRRRDDPRRRAAARQPSRVRGGPLGNAARAACATEGRPVAAQARARGRARRPPGSRSRRVDAATAAGTTGGRRRAVLDDLERLGPAELQATLDYLRGGGAVLVALGRRADPTFWNSSLLLGSRRRHAREISSRLLAGAAWRLSRRAAGHPVLSGFRVTTG